MGSNYCFVHVYQIIKLYNMIRCKQNNWQQPKLCFQDTMDRSIDKAVSFIFFRYSPVISNGISIDNTNWHTNIKYLFHIQIIGVNLIKLKIKRNDIILSTSL